jgi:hypothetical protein
MFFTGEVELRLDLPPRLTFSKGGETIAGRPPRAARVGGRVKL